MLETIVNYSILVAIVTGLYAIVAFWVFAAIDEFISRKWWK